MKQARPGAPQDKVLGMEKTAGLLPICCINKYIVVSAVDRSLVKQCNSAADCDSKAMRVYSRLDHAEERATELAFTVPTECT